LSDLPVQLKHPEITAVQRWDSARDVF